MRNLPVFWFVILFWTSLSIGQAAAEESFVSEVRAGLYAHDIGDDFHRVEEPPVAAVGELLFARPNWGLNNRFASYLLSPRPHLGAYVTGPRGTSFGYFGFTWDLSLMGPFFAEVGFGGAIQTGEVGTNDPKRRDLGSTMHFHQQITLGVELTEKLRLLATMQHISNANLANTNPGLNVAGAKIGYKF